MRLIKFFFLASVFLVACTKNTKHVDCGLCGVNLNRVEEPETPEEAMAIVKQADTSTTGNAEFKENKK